MFYKVVDAILLFGGKDTIFPRNFQGFWEKCRYDDKEKKSGSRYVRESPSNLGVPA
jgi:hypothetical protein